LAIIVNYINLLKTPTREADQLAIYKVKELNLGPQNTKGIALTTRKSCLQKAPIAYVAVNVSSIVNFQSIYS